MLGGIFYVSKKCYNICMTYFNNTFWLLAFAWLMITLYLLKKDPKQDSGETATNKSSFFTKKNWQPVIAKYTQDLTQLAREKKLDPVIGRDTEIRRVVQILSRRKKNNVILVGKAGIGKTAIAEGLAMAIADNQVPSSLMNKVVLKVEMSAVLAGTKYRGEFENRFKTLIDTIIAMDKQIIVFIDEIHTIVEAGGAEGAIDADDIIKAPLARGELQMLGTTTIDEYKKYILPDTTLTRRFDALLIEEPSKAATIKILQGLKKSYEEYHRVIISDEIIKKIVEHSTIIKDRVFPDKAIDIMDELAAKVRLDNVNNKSVVKVSLKDLQEVMAFFKKQNF
ncbi:MAG: ATP-dependent Clp protease ATP-binding subunit [Patescibacteria group bacterium]|nr:ATP-dependent Clp protease ATP-binding subunit [Patescibacteria group bacterium]